MGKCEHLLKSLKETFDLKSPNNGASYFCPYAISLTNIPGVPSG